MSHPHHAHDPGIADLLGHPWTQGIITGVLTLIPARNYPRWLRRSLVWGPLASASIASAYFGAKPQVMQQLVRKHVAEDDSDDSDALENGKYAGEQKTSGGVRGATRMLIPGVAIGAVFSGSIAVALWADEKMDRALRRAGVRAPRLVMGVVAGALTWWSVTTEQRDRESSTHD